GDVEAAGSRLQHSVGVLPGRATDVLSQPPPQCTHNSADVEKLKKKNKSGGCGDDEMADDEDGGEDEEDEEDDDRKFPWRAFPVKLSPATCRPRLVSPVTSRPGRLGFIAEDSGDEEEEYHFVNKYPSLQEPSMLVEEESCPVYDTDNEEESEVIHDTDGNDVDDSLEF
nr:hypothetical protein [Tanacetum cinerariifolium]